MFRNKYNEVTRKNRSHLRLRDPEAVVNQPSHPREKAMPMIGRKETIQVDTHIDDNPSPDQPEASSQETVNPTPRRSSRVPKPVQKLDL